MSRNIARGEEAHQEAGPESRAQVYVRLARREAAIDEDEFDFPPDENLAPRDGSILVRAPQILPHRTGGSGIHAAVS